MSCSVRGSDLLHISDDIAESFDGLLGHILSVAHGSNNPFAEAFPAGVVVQPIFHVTPVGDIDRNIVRCSEVLEVVGGGVADDEDAAIAVCLMVVRGIVGNAVRVGNDELICKQNFQQVPAFQGSGFRVVCHVE